MIGLYDSGLGGLTVLRALRAAGVDQDIMYFADQAHVPYGGRPPEELHGFLRDNLALLGASRVDAVVMACNTSCAVAADLGWPQTPFPVLDIIASAARGIAASPYRRIAVIATAATVASGAYERAIAAIAPHVTVTAHAAPALVPIVEAGRAETSEAGRAVAAAVEDVPRDVDAILYGCTHYPLLDAHFAAALGPAIARVDAAQAQAQAARELIASRRITAGNATTRYATNGDPHAFGPAVSHWTGERTPAIVSLQPV